DIVLPYTVYEIMKWRVRFAIATWAPGRSPSANSPDSTCDDNSGHILWGVSGHVHTPNCGAFRDNAQRPNGRNALHSTTPSLSAPKLHPIGVIIWGITQSRLLLRIVEESKASHRGVGLLGRPGFFFAESTYKTPQTLNEYLSTNPSGRTASMAKR